MACGGGAGSVTRAEEKARRQELRFVCRVRERKKVCAAGWPLHQCLRSHQGGGRLLEHMGMGQTSTAEGPAGFTGQHFGVTLLLTHSHMPIAESPGRIPKCQELSPSLSERAQARGSVRGVPASLRPTTRKP